MPVKLNLNEQAHLNGLNWFHSADGQAVLAAEQAIAEEILDGQPLAPWLWLGVSAGMVPEAPYGVHLRRAFANVNANNHTETPESSNFGEIAMNRYRGSVICDLPLPFANESFTTILIQHALDDGRDWHYLLSECERVLAPGGLLWITALNTWSPYRLHWMRRRLHVMGVSQWQKALGYAGFDPRATSVQWLGPRWRVSHGEAGVGPLDFFRASLALKVKKQTLARIKGKPIRRAAAWKPQVVAKSQTQRPHDR